MLRYPIKSSISSYSSSLNRQTLTSTKSLLYLIKVPQFSKQVLPISPISFITFSQAYHFCNLPRSSKFSQELGLQRQFKSIQKQSKKNQRVKIRLFSTVIWIFFSLIGSFCYFWVYDEEQKDKMMLVLKYLRFKTNRTRIVDLLESVLQFNNDYYHDKPHSNQILSYILKQIVITIKNRQIDKKCEKLLLSNLVKNTKNFYGKKRKVHDEFQIKYNQNEEIYRFYFEHLLLHPAAYQEANINDILVLLIFLSEYGSIKSLFIAARITKEFKILDRTPEKLKSIFLGNIKSRVESEKILIKKAEDKIKILQKNEANLIGGIKENKRIFFQKTMVEPYEYNCNVHTKWVNYVASLTDTVSNS